MRNTRAGVFRVPVKEGVLVEPANNLRGVKVRLAALAREDLPMVTRRFEDVSFGRRHEMLSALLRREWTARGPDAAAA